MSFLISLIDVLLSFITLLVIVHVFLSYFMSPFHPVRATISRIVEPLLRPIRNILPPTGMIDLSPIILIILVQVIRRILIRLFTVL
jgi:YggT family protein